MKPIKIITDSCSDLPKSLREAYGIDYCSMSLIRKGVTAADSLDLSEEESREFYLALRSGELIGTAPIKSSDLEEKFRHYALLGFDIVFIGCSGRLFHSLAVGARVAEALVSEFPDTDFVCIDSCRASMGEGMLAVKAAELRDRGLSAHEIAAAIHELKRSVNQFLTVPSIASLRRSNLVLETSRLFGRLLNAKPILISDNIGNNVPIKTVRGGENAIREIVRLAAETIDGDSDQTVYIMHSDSIGEAKALDELIRRSTGCKTEILPFDNVIAASAGAGMFGVYCVGKDAGRFIV